MNTKKRFDAYTLKLIACTALIINYATLLFIKNNTLGFVVGMSIGRIAFPIAAFCIVEGFLHSSDLKKYIIRLFVLAVISEPCADFALKTYKTNLFSYQNVVFTLLIGLIAVYFYDRIITKYKNDNFTMNMLLILVIFISTFSAILLRTDYSIVGVLLILIFYIFRTNSRIMFVAYIAVCGIFMDDSSTVSIIYSFAPMLALPFIYKYNGQEGIKKQKFFYPFYPILLIITGILGTFV